MCFDYSTMATIRLTVLSSIKEHDGRLPILVCISQKKERAYIKTEFLLDDIAEFDNGKVAYRKDANVMNIMFMPCSNFISLNIIRKV